MMRARTTAVLLVTTGMATVAMPAQAQDIVAAPPALLAGEGVSATDSSTQGLQDIVVTAQKRKESLQKVPISITAIDGQKIKDRNIQLGSDLVSAIPGLQLVSNTGTATPIFSLRGVSMADYSLNQASPVATYFGEVYKGNPALLGVNLFDVDHIEVLRGPQGTLYGKNTTGGAINFIPKTPGNDFEGYVSAGYGNYHRIDIDGAIQAPVSSTLSVRAAFTFSKADGWFKNLLPGKPDLAGTRQYGARMSALWQPTATFKLLVTGNISYQDPYNYAVLPQPGANGVGNGVYASYGASDYFRRGLGKREGEIEYTPRRHALAKSLSAKADLNLGSDLTLTSVTSYDFGKLDFGEDSDGSPLKTLEYYYQDEARQFSQDIRLANGDGNRFRFLLGAYYNVEKVFNLTRFLQYNDVDYNHDDQVNNQDCIDSGLAYCQFQNSFDQIKHSFAVYGDASYKLDETFSLRGGLRFTRDTGRQYNFNSKVLLTDGTPYENLIPGSATNVDATTQIAFTQSNLSGKIGVDYTSSLGLAYASFSRGYRAPSFNAQAFFSPAELSVAKPEIIDAFELGLKSKTIAQALKANIAIFYYDYHNQQFINFNPVTSVQTLINLDRSRILGGEAELTWRASQALTLGVSASTLFTKVLRGSVGGVDVAGNKLITAPPLTISGNVDWTLAEGNWGSARLHANAYWLSSQYFEILNESDLKQDSYAVFDGQIDWRSADSRYGISLWIKNITNAYYYTARVNISGYGYNYNQASQPRTFGIKADARF